MEDGHYLHKVDDRLLFLFSEYDIIVLLTTGAQWLSGRALDSRPKGRGFEPHRRHCVVSLSKNINPSLVLVQPRKICPFITEELLMGRKESNQTKQTKLLTTPRLLYMLLALNYPVGLHDLCLDSTAASYFKPSHGSPGAADLIIWRSPLWYEKRCIFKTFCHLEVLSK